MSEQEMERSSWRWRRVERTGFRLTVFCLAAAALQRVRIQVNPLTFLLGALLGFLTSLIAAAQSFYTDETLRQMRRMRDDD